MTGSTHPAPRDVRDSSVRVILLGAQELEQAWRRDERVGLVRARSGFEVIGEVGRPEGRTIVIIDQDRESKERPDAIATAVRHVDPNVRVMHLRREDDSLDLRLAGPAWDGVVDVTTTVDELLDADPEVVVKVNGAPEARSHSRLQPTTEVRREDEGLSFPASADIELTRRLLAGESLVDPCVALLRERTGLVGLTLASEPVDGGVPVSHRGHHLGWLSGGGDSDLGDAAAWLGSWLALAEQQSQLRTAAFTDPLTGAWNRRYFDRFLRKAIDEARLERRCLSLLLFDIDDFKSYNDRFGHPAGDEILTETVKLLTAVVRPTDRVCRIGGDEFAILFHEPDGPRNPPSQHPGSIFEIAHRIRNQIRSHHFPRLGQEGRGCLTISGGLATFPWDGHDAPSLIEHADRLTLESKSQGKNVICFGNAAEPGYSSATNPEHLGDH